MMSVHVTADDVGIVFVDKDGKLWKMIAYCAEPQATFECLEPGVGGERVSHAVGCFYFNSMGLQRLRPDDAFMRFRPLDDEASCRRCCLAWRFHRSNGDCPV